MKLMTWIRLIIGCICLTLAIMAHASVAKDRKLFIQAHKAIQAGKIKKAVSLSKKLRHFVLYPYLEYGVLSRRLSHQKASEITRFLQKYQDTPLADRLRRQWLFTLAKQQRWQSFLKHYKDFGNTRLHCYHLQARIHSKQSKSLRKAIEKTWLSANSRPKACDKAFRYLEKTWGFNKDLVWERIRLATEKRNRQLIVYLKKLLPKSERKLVQVWLEADRQPEKALRHPLLRQKHPFTYDIIIHAMNRLSDKDVQKAAKHWSKIKGNYKLNDSHKAEIKRHIAMRMATRYQKEAARWLAKVPSSHVDKTVREWRIRHALVKGDWKATHYWITRLPQDERKTEQWQYWQARALDKLGQKQEAKSLFETLSQAIDYYGLLSAETLKIPYAIVHEPIYIDKNIVQSLLQIPSIKRAKELFLIHHYLDARREWRYSLNKMNKEQQQAAAHLAHEWGWHDRVIISSREAEMETTIKMQFPLANRGSIIQEAKKRQIDPAWTFAIARQESLFIKDARSRMGALGIMQILPTTAYRIAKDFKFRYRNRYDLLNSKTNIRFGTAYLKKMYDLYAQNPVLATAAYNAGPRSVRKWLPEVDTPADIWIDTIPYYETRGYLKKVLAYAVIYDYQLGRKPSMSRRMKIIAMRDKYQNIK